MKDIIKMIKKANNKEEMEEILRGYRLSLREYTMILEKDFVKKDRTLLLKILTKPEVNASLAFQFFPTLFPMDLVKIIKTASTNIFVKQMAMQNLAQKYEQLQIGERRVIMRMIPPEFLRMVKEKDSIVLSEILKNSRLTETELLTIINRQKPSPQFLKMLYADKRWRNRERILFALISSSYFSKEIIMNSLKKLSRNHLLELSRKPFISQDIKTEIRKLMTGKKFS